MFEMPIANLEGTQQISKNFKTYCRSKLTFRLLHYSTEGQHHYSRMITTIQSTSHHIAASHCCQCIPDMFGMKFLLQDCFNPPSCISHLRGIYYNL